MAPKNIHSCLIIFTLCLALMSAVIPDSVKAASLTESAPAKEQVIKFYLDPALVPDINFAKAVLPKYVADMNAILAKNTDRQLVFDPENDIVLTNTPPQTNNAIPPLPVEGFEIWAIITKSNYPVSYGGYASLDMSGAGVLAGLRWLKLYDPDQLGSLEVTDYWTQINNMLHELAHVFGAGIGEYYNLYSIKDTTGVSPLLDIDILNPADSFWSDKPDFMSDPLLRNAARPDGLKSFSTRSDLLNYVKYSNLTAAIINGDYRNSVPTVDLSHIVVQVISPNGMPVEAANVKIWSRAGVAPYETQLIADDSTDTDGQIAFTWGGAVNPHNAYDFLREIKVYKDGYISQAKYVSIFDADISKIVKGMNIFTITITLNTSKPVSDFSDVPVSDFAWPWIQRLTQSGITSGCGIGTYCPNSPITRAQMAIFIERAMHGSSYTPPTTPSIFTDASGNWAQNWITALASDGITDGCGNGNYCPNASVSRAQMAIFLLHAEHGTKYIPPPASGTMFRDVPSSYWSAPWIEQLAKEEITGGCGNGDYCPDAPVTRAQMAIFIVKAFKLP